MNIRPYLRNLTLGLTLLLTGCATGIEIAPARQVTHCQLPDQGVLAAIVRVTAGASNASSGVVIGKNRVLTVAHAIPDGIPVSIQFNDDVREATPLAISKGLDLALLDVDTDSIAPLEISATDLQANEQVWAVGFPLAREQRTSLGVVQQFSGTNLITSAHINHGTSGGGLLRCGQQNFELAGIVRAYLAIEIAGDVINSGDSVAVSAATVTEFIDRTVRYANDQDGTNTNSAALEITTSYRVVR